MKKIGLFSFMYALIFLNVNAFACYSLGAIGNEVKNIQVCLRAEGYYSGAIDGIYGKGTERGVKIFQGSHKLCDDGIVGASTMKEINRINKDNIYLLAKIINGEARGESFSGQVAVGAVILNRVKSPSFPNTISGVIYQKGAFSALNDGQANKKINSSCIKAAKAALSGSDPTNGALFYYNPKTATDKWIRTRKIVKVIGNHAFCV